MAVVDGRAEKQSQHTYVLDYVGPLACMGCLNLVGRYINRTNGARDASLLFKRFQSLIVCNMKYLVSK